MISHQIMPPEKGRLYFDGGINSAYLPSSNFRPPF